MNPLFILLFIGWSLADNLRVAYEWKQLDYDFPSAADRQEAIDTKQFISENNLPLGLEVHKDRLFITVPRWRSGVPATLTYINLTSDPKDSPKLKPYPNWEAHKLRDNDKPEIVSPFRIRADRCNRLWVLDTGSADILDDLKVLSPPSLKIYDLYNDQLLHTYEIPKDQYVNDSFFVNIAVEDHDCINSFAYLADINSINPAIVVYSWEKRSSWRITHNYFHIDPLEGEFNISGYVFVWDDGIFGLALSKPDQEGYSTLYFHPLSSTNEFSVSTKYLRDPNLAKNNSKAFKLLGSRGPRSQSNVSFLDKKTDVLFYALLNLNAIACWRTTNPSYTMESQGRVYMSNVTMIFPNDIKVDGNDNLWVLSDKLPTFMYSSLDLDEVNFRILTAKVSDAIRHTACDSKLVLNPDVMEKYKPGVVVNQLSGSQPLFIFNSFVAILSLGFLLFR